MSQPDPRSPTQVAEERAASEVSAVLTNIEHALSRARRAHKVVVKDGVDRNAEIALAEAIESINKLRKRLMQDAYFSGDAVRLI